MARRGRCVARFHATTALAIHSVSCHLWIRPLSPRNTLAAILVMNAERGSQSSSVGTKWGDFLRQLQALRSAA